MGRTARLSLVVALASAAIVACDSPKGEEAPAAPTTSSSTSASPTKAPARAPTKTPTKDPRYATCKEAKAHGYGPYVKGQDPEYAWYRDGDSDGIACERN